MHMIWRMNGVWDVFWRCARAHEEWWDWFGVGRVPGALNKVMETRSGNCSQSDA